MFVVKIKNATHRWQGKQKAICMQLIERVAHMLQGKGRVLDCKNEKIHVQVTNKTPIIIIIK